MPTRDEIAAEMKKRGISPPSQSEDINQELSRRGVNPVQNIDPMREYNEMWEQNPAGVWFAEKMMQNPKLGSALKGITELLGPAATGIRENIIDPVYEKTKNTGIPAFAVGAAQGVANPLISAANLFAKEGEELPHMDWTSKLPSNVPNLLGGVAGQIAGGFKGPVASTYEASQMIGPQTGWSKLAADIAKGMGLGYALGETPEHDRTIGTVAGGVLAPLHSIQNKEIGKTIKNVGQEKIAKHGSEISGSLKDVSVSKPKVTKSIQAIKQGKLDDVKLTNIAPAKKAINEAYKLKTGESFQHAISTLKELQRNLVKKIPGGNENLLNDRAFTTYETATKAIENLTKQLQKNMSPAQFSRYMESLGQYKANAVPYSELFKTGYKPEQFAQQILKGANKPGRTGEYAQHLAKQHPQIGLNAMSRKYAPYLLAGGAGTGAVMAGKSYLSNLLHQFLGGYGEHD